MKIPLDEMEFCACCGYIKPQCECEKKQTNAERIRAMSDEELALFLANFEQQDIGNEWCFKLCPKREEKRDSGVDCDCPYENYETALAWLQSEVKEKNMTEQEAIMQIQAIPQKIWEQLSETDNEAVEMAFKALEEIQQYRAIGTQEECRTSVEKQKAKKPDFEGDGYADGHLVYDTWICPCCGKNYEVDYDDYDFCPNCGQKLDWRDKISEG